MHPQNLKKKKKQVVVVLYAIAVQYWALLSQSSCCGQMSISKLGYSEFASKCKHQRSKMLMFSM